MVMKTPMRSQKLQTPTGAKEGGRKSANGLRQSGMKPFGRVDTNMGNMGEKHSSRKSRKQASSQSKKHQTEMFNSFGHNFGATAFSTNQESKRPTPRHG